jgi:hypothetical protein
VGEEQTYWGFVEEFTENKACDMGAELTLEMTDEERGIGVAVIEEYKIGPKKVHDIRAEARLIGREECCTLRLYIDDEEYNSRSLGMCGAMGRLLVRDEK